MPFAREYELKFEIAQDDVAHLVSHPLLKAALRDRRVSRLVSTYFDTPDSLLRANSISLRSRRSAAGCSNTLKRSGASFVDRDEWEQVDAAGDPDAAWLSGTPLAPFFSRDQVRESLAARFTVDVMRTTLPLRFEGTTIEGALDQGAIRADGGSLPVHELELELKDGSAAGVNALARELARDLPLVLSLASKAERGYGLVDLSWGNPTKAIPLHLTDAMSLAETFEAIVQACLHTLLVNAALIKEGDDDEAVHATRIALRRLRAALDLFKPALRRDRLHVLRGEVKWMSDRLGHARDSDVLRTEVLARTSGETGLPGADALVDMLAAARHAAHDQLREALGSPRWRLLVLDLVAFSGEGVRRKRGGMRFEPFVGRRLAKRQDSLARRGRKPSSLPSDAMHGVRKAAKMLRYNLEFFERTRVGRPKRMAKLRGALNTIQEQLGAIHDREALEAYLREKVPRSDVTGGASVGASPIVSSAADRIASATADLGDAFKRADKAARRVGGIKAFHR